MKDNIKASHAPTPWKINRISRWHDGTPQEFDLLAVVSSQGHQLATTHDCKPQSIATANLIAASPDLLNALKALMVTEHMLRDENCEVMRNAKLAIQKAEGK